jgi:hypothetical protein
MEFAVSSSVLLITAYLASAVHFICLCEEAPKAVDD